MWHYIFPKTRWNKNKQWTHLGALKLLNVKEPTEIFSTVTYGNKLKPLSILGIYGHFSRRWKKKLFIKYILIDFC